MKQLPLGAPEGLLEYRNNDREDRRENIYPGVLGT